MRKNEVEDLLLSEIEEVKGGSSSSTCICERGGAGETVITLPIDPAFYSEFKKEYKDYTPTKEEISHLLE